MYKHRQEPGRRDKYPQPRPQARSTALPRMALRLHIVGFRLEVDCPATRLCVAMVLAISASLLLLALLPLIRL